MNLIIQVKPRDGGRSLARLLTIPMGLDVWEAKPDYLTLRTSEAQADRLRQMGYLVTEIHQVPRFLERFSTLASTQGFHTVQTLEADLKKLVASHPDVSELREIGRSVEGRSIWAMRIGHRQPTSRKLLFMGCHHAREWVAVEVPYLLAEYLVSNAAIEPVKSWLTSGEIWVAPMVNPDGHEYTRTTDRLWRKNRRANSDGSFGVDPNRNYGYHWGVLDVSTSSHVPSDETYIGPHAFSEPETQAIRDLVTREQFRGVLTYHSFSQLILYPWGYTPEPVANIGDHHRMESLSARMAQLIEGVHGKVYTPEQSSSLYPTAGDTTDWTFGTFRIPSFTIELRPSSVDEGGFILPADQIQPTWEENRPAALEFIQHVL
jgi:carboxypeptidase T